MSEELAPRSAFEVLDPLAQSEARRIISHALAAAGLSERERYGIEWRLRRRRGKFFLELFEIESQTVLSETAVAGDSVLAEVPAGLRSRLAREGFVEIATGLLHDAPSEEVRRYILCAVPLTSFRVYARRRFPAASAAIEA